MSTGALSVGQTWPEYCGCGTGLSFLGMVPFTIKPTLTHGILTALGISLTFSSAASLWATTRENFLFLGAHVITLHPHR